MSQVSNVLRSIQGGFAHWCVACDQMHVIPTGAPYKVHWTFDGNVEAPTFGPSVKITWGRGEQPPLICHYFVRAGCIEYCSDSTHTLAGKTLPLTPPPADEDWTDEEG